MILISNIQRDEMVRYIDALCEALQPSLGKSTRAHNTVRLAKKLRARLAAKQPATASDLQKALRISQPEK